MNEAAPARAVPETSWEALTWFNAYRFLVSFLFVALYWIGQLPEPLGNYDQVLFGAAAHSFLGFSLAAAFFIRVRRPSCETQAAAHVFADIIVITLFMYSSAGLSSGFGILLVIAVAGGALLTPGKIGYLYAAVAAIAVLGHEVYSQLHDVFPDNNYTHAGFLGMTFFVTALVGNALAARVEESEELARQRAIALSNLARLNERIVQHMQSGIVVLDAELRVTLINAAARGLLGLAEPAVGQRMRDLSPELETAVQAWQRAGGSSTTVLPVAAAGVDVQASFARLGGESRVDTLVFLEDVAVLRQRAQQLKLASLGRLTASIAHEVRNPLGAISHAGQLLSESPALNDEERRLTAIIEEQSRRVNRIVEDILRISRRRQARTELVDLSRWLEDFRSEFLLRYNLSPSDMALELDAGPLEAGMDPDQLHQVLWNLCENALRYSRGTPLLLIRGGVQRDTGRPFVEIVDRGPGVAAEIREQLFEPFFTTEAQGTGLGLYIARELCEANQALLQLRYAGPGGSCFRIDFAHPQRQHAIS